MIFIIIHVTNNVQYKVNRLLVLCLRFNDTFMLSLCLPAKFALYCSFMNNDPKSNPNSVDNNGMLQLFSCNSVGNTS